MGICANCITRESNIKKNKQLSLEIKTFEFSNEENCYFKEFSIEREEKLKNQSLKVPEKEVFQTENTENGTPIIKVSKKKRIRSKICKNAKKAKGFSWTEDDEKVFNGLIKKYNGDEQILLKHFAHKKPLLAKKLKLYHLQMCKNSISSEQLKADYQKYEGNWAKIAEFYNIKPNVLRNFFYSYVYSDCLKKEKPHCKEIDTEFTNNHQNYSLFDTKDKSSPALSTSKKGDPSVSELNEETLVEEKISYLSTRKEILESLQNYLNEEEDDNFGEANE